MTSMGYNEARWRLRESPLVYVLAQVVISPVMLMSEYIPKIQEELRKNGFPRFQENQIQEIALIQQQQVQTRTSTRWIFLSADGQEAIVVSNGFIVLETSNYATFENFLGKLRLATEIIDSAVDISLAERLGLRYVDLIQPKSDETFSDYLNPGLVGLPEERKGTERISHSVESRDKTNIGGQLIVRLLQSSRGGFLPPDLEAPHLTFNNKPPADAVTSILDIDHFINLQEEFAPAKLLEVMWQLHGFTKQTFETAVTKQALEKWGKEELEG